MFPHVDEKASLPCSLVKESVVIMVHAFCTNGFSSEVSQATVELVIGQCADALLDDKFSIDQLAKISSGSQDRTGSILRVVNKVSRKPQVQCATLHTIVFHSISLFLFA